MSNVWKNRMANRSSGRLLRSLPRRIQAPVSSSVSGHDGQFVAFLRIVAMIVIFLGTVAGYISYRLLAPLKLPSLNLWSPHPYGAAIPLVLEGPILLKSNWSFASVGRGTLAQSWFFWSGRLLVYTCLCFIVANILITSYEENRPKYKYGDEFRRYCEHVGRWVPGNPYDHAG